jgi:hypothetical protein
MLDIHYCVLGQRQRRDIKNDRTKEKSNKKETIRNSFRQCKLGHREEKHAERQCRKTVTRLLTSSDSLTFPSFLAWHSLISKITPGNQDRYHTVPRPNRRSRIVTYFSSSPIRSWTFPQAYQGVRDFHPREACSFRAGWQG